MIAVGGLESNDTEVKAARSCSTSWPSTSRTAKPNAPPLVRERFQVLNFARAAIGLVLVVIDQDREVRPRRCLPAHIAASQTDPSLHSPSPRITNTANRTSRA